MKEITVLIRVRLIQLRGQLKSLGFYAPVPLFLALVFYAYIVNTVVTAKWEGMFTLFLLFAFLGLHQGRRDGAFVVKHLPRPAFIMFAEYFFYAAFFFPLYVYTGRWELVLLLVAGLFGIASVPQFLNKRTKTRSFSWLVADSCFEWVAGLRKSFLWLLPLYLLALALSFQPFVSLFILWLITTNLCSFFNEGESLQMLHARSSSSSLLGYVIRLYSLQWLKWFLPVVILNLLFNPGYWYVSIVFVVSQLVYLVVSIVLKYTFYEPTKKSIGSSVLVSFLALSALVPFLFPLPFMMLLVYLPKAKNKLNTYLR